MRNHQTATVLTAGERPRVLFCTLFFSFFAFFTHDVAAQPSAAEIVAASKAAMGQSMQYRLIAGGIETIVYQKPLPDGSMAQRTESLSPLTLISITHGDESYELYPNHKTAVDRHFILQAASSLAGATQPFADNSAATATIKGTVTRDGKTCFDIEWVLAPEVMAHLAKTVPPEARNMLPAKFRYIIEQDTFMMVSMDTVSSTGRVILSTEFKDITLNPDLPDDLFLVPDGYDVKKPNSITEYVSLLSGMHDEDLHSSAPPELTRRQPPFRKPPERTAPSFSALVQSIESAEKHEAESPPTNRVRTILISTLVLFLILAAVGLYYLRTNTRNATARH